MMTSPITLRWLGQVDYDACWQAMRQFTDQRNEQTPDEIWLLEHSPVFTQGQNGKNEHILDTGSIPVVKTDRGGQVTYHGPGQLIVYTLIDLRRRQLTIRAFVSLLEQAVIALLANDGIEAVSKCHAPGVYVGEKKICSLGLRVRHGCTYHGLAFNIDMDLAPFTRIHPCGFHHLQMTQYADYIKPSGLQEIGHKLADYLLPKLT